jgi:hypothetical protein
MGLQNYGCLREIGNWRRARSIKLDIPFTRFRLSLAAVSTVVSPHVDFDALLPAFRAAAPFNHVVIDNFFEPGIADGLAREFPEFDSNIWWEYQNSIEIKKACNLWDKFPRLTYSVFNYLNSPAFVARIGTLAGDPLFPDPGLNGGGWHTHRPGGKLNTHLDYSIHPKLGLERRINLIVYMQPNWQPEWGGSLGLWAPDESGKAPGELVQEIPCLFNRAVIFDTSQNSWHGLPEPVRSPEGICRNSIATYYLCEPRAGASDRGRALFAPYGEQANDKSVMQLIEQRSQVGTSASVYRTKDYRTED